MKYLFLLTLLLSIHAKAEPTYNKKLSLGVTQSFGETKNSNADDSINITSIKPSYSLEYSKRKLSLDLSYSLNAISDNSNNETSVNHDLNLNTSFQHIPDEWITSFRSSVFQKNTSDTGILISNSIDSEDTETFRINSLESSRTFFITKDSLFLSQLQLSSQGFKNQNTSKNAQLKLQFDINEVFPSVNLSSSIEGNKDLNEDQSNNTINIITTYLINNKLDSFLSITKNSSSNDSFDENKYTLGTNWQVSPKSLIKLEVGKFGDQDSWGLTANTTSKRTSFSLVHNEKVTPANIAILNNLVSGASNFSSSIISDIKYIKNTSLSINHRQRRLTSSFTTSKIEEFSDLGLTSDRTTYGNILSLQYALSSTKNLTYSYSNNKISTLIDNQLKEHTVNWSTVLGRHSQYNIGLSNIEQSSDNLSLNTKRNQINFNYTYTF